MGIAVIAIVIIAVVALIGIPVLMRVFGEAVERDPEHQENDEREENGQNRGRGSGRR